MGGVAATIADARPTLAQVMAARRKIIPVDIFDSAKIHREAENGRSAESNNLFYVGRQLIPCGCHPFNPFQYAICLC